MMYVSQYSAACRCISLRVATADKSELRMSISRPSEPECDSDNPHASEDQQRSERYLRYGIQVVTIKYRRIKAAQSSPVDRLRAGRFHGPESEAAFFAHEAHRVGIRGPEYEKHGGEYRDGCHSDTLARSDFPEEVMVHARFGQRNIGIILAFSDRASIYDGFCGSRASFHPMVSRCACSLSSCRGSRILLPLPIDPAAYPSHYRGEISSGKRIFPFANVYRISLIRGGARYVRSMSMQMCDHGASFVFASVSRVMNSPPSHSITCQSLPSSRRAYIRVFCVQCPPSVKIVSQTYSYQSDTSVASSSFTSRTSASSKVSPASTPPPKNPHSSHSLEKLRRSCTNTRPFES
jgi:hypothetical protein